MRLIGLAGLKTSGKDTTYKIIKKIEYDRYSGNKVERAAFADKLKVFSARAIGFPEGTEVEAMEEFKNSGVIRVFDNHAGADAPVDTVWITNGRQYLQNVGQAAREVFDIEFWVNQVLPIPRFDDVFRSDREASQYALRGMYPEADIVVITDVRYPNEAMRIKELDGEIWQIERPGLESDGHASEVPLDAKYVTKVLVNDGSEDDLYAKVKAIL